jgi:hypothetical protein
MLKYELKEKDLDIVQFQREINELQLENKMLKAKIPLLINNNNESKETNESISMDADDNKNHFVFKKKQLFKKQI